MGIGRSHRETRCLAARRGYYPQCRAIRMLLLVDGCYHKGDPLTIRRDTRPAKKFKLVQIFNSNGSCHYYYFPVIYNFKLIMVFRPRHSKDTPHHKNLPPAPQSTPADKEPRFPLWLRAAI